MTDATTIATATTNHARRWPIASARMGMRTRSTAGAQIGFRLYSRIPSANAVTVFFSIPASASRVVSVAPIIA